MKNLQFLRVIFFIPSLLFCNDLKEDLSSQGWSPTRWECNDQNQITALIEADKKKTEFSYDQKQLQTLTKPDGVVLEYLYDDQHRLASISSSDGTCAYAYHYNVYDDVVEAINLITGEKIARSYNLPSQLLEETFPKGFSIKSRYDAEGRRIELILPDESSISYEYEDKRLISVTRKSPQGQDLYTHRYLGSNEQEMISDLGKISFSFDSQGRLTGLDSPFGNESIEEFDERGNILKMRRFSHDSSFKYDDLDQLIEENGHSYSYDGLYNRLSKDGASYDIDELHQLTSVYKYDACGRPVQKNDLFLSYDALDRLIRVEKTKTFRLDFTYDGFHRRLSQTLYRFEQEDWKLEKSLNFIYDQQYEIGAIDDTGTIAELRILGHCDMAERGAAIAIEIDGETFAPLHDLCGNVAGLISEKTRSLVEANTFSAFGETGLSINPWGYASKRVDPLTGLVYFGRRFYDPDTGRWLTPDPEGYIDGMNRYVFVFNNPLKFADLYGLHGILSKLGAWIGTALQKFCYHFVPFTGVRDIGIVLGGFLGATPIPDGDLHCHTGTIEGDNLPSDHVNVLINGLNTNLKDTISYAEFIATASGGQTVNYAYNCTHGFMADLWEHLSAKFNFRTKALECALDAIRLSIKDVGGVEGNGTVTIWAHSAGGVIVERALSFLTREEKKMLQIYTFGTGAFFFRDGKTSVQHIVSRNDYIPILSDPLRYVVSQVWDPTSIKFVPGDDSLGVFDNHYFLGPGYQQEVLKLLKALK